MRIKLETNSLELLKKAKRADKKIAFATVNAINNTAKALQQKVQASAKDDMHIRSSFSLRQSAIIKPFASVGQSRAYAEVSVGKRENLLLPELATRAHEKRQPFTPGAKRVAVPIIQGQPRARFPQKLPREMYWKALGLKRWPRGTAKGARPAYPGEKKAVQTIWRGRLGSYMIPSLGVFRRTSAGKSEPVFLFDDDVPIPKRLQFVDIMEREAPAELNEQMERSIIKELQRGL